MTDSQQRTEKQRQRLIELLEQLFQLDQPDLDFGFYKIMHAKAQTVSNFLHNDLLTIITDAFGQADEDEVERARLQYEESVRDATAYGVPEPEITEPVKKARKKYEAAQQSSANEGELYEHLYRFFERYYDNGDFLSRRYYARETATKAAPYAVPYDGREVYLHWANRDQYYIKTAEYLNNFTVDLANATELQDGMFQQPSLKLHCRIVEAAEGEHNNNKANGKTERFFLIHTAQPVVLENGELVLQFEYRPDSQKTAQNGTWQKQRIDEAEHTIFNVLEGMTDAAHYNKILRIEIGDDNKRTLLRKYLNRYTKRNTTDYFIHKDLRGFLTRELDFYIKNEIMHLDDIVNADAPQVESYLSKIKVLRKIASYIITILTQLEEFQKKLWLKKKFVTETNYCITLDRIPQSFYADIAANEAQRTEWVSLFAIDQLDGYSTPLTTQFLVANPFLVLDTAFFPATFKDALVATMHDVDANLDGLLIHSENFQALGLMQEKYKQQVKCIYIDPPYNTGNDGFIYKDSYQHSGWMSMMENRLIKARKHSSDDGVVFISIDDNEQARLKNVCNNIFGEENFVGTLIHQRAKGGGNAKHIVKGHDYVLIYSKYLSSNHKFIRDKVAQSKVVEIDGEFFVRDDDVVRKVFGKYDGSENRRCFYDELDKYKSKEQILKIEQKLNAREYVLEDFGNGRMVFVKYTPLNDSYSKLYSIINALSEKGSQELINFGLSFSNPKNVELVNFLANSITNSKSYILDYFAGSGTTGHAVVNLNRADGGRRKYIMVEMGSYFDSVTKPRMQKVVYATGWKDGKPVSCNGISHAFKYIRLESYEDTLNNLTFKQDAVRDKTLAQHDTLRRDYMLKYWLDFETKDSPSLLNIESFDNPREYTLNIKQPGSDEYQETAIDLVETFNWLIGLHVDRSDQWRSYTASFIREPDHELPDDNATRLLINGDIKETKTGTWQFRTVEGRVCSTPGDIENTDRVLIIWRNLTGNLEEDNVMLDALVMQYRQSHQDTMPDILYVNGSNNLPLLRTQGEHWKVRLIEEAFHHHMWDVST